MTDVEEMYRAWRRQPPLSALMARFVGFAPPDEEAEGSVDPGEWEKQEAWLEKRLASLAEGKG